MVLFGLGINSRNKGHMCPLYPHRISPLNKCHAWERKGVRLPHHASIYAVFCRLNLNVSLSIKLIYLLCFLSHLMLKHGPANSVLADGQ
jgi:hypothetical protein